MYATFLEWLLNNIFGFHVDVSKPNSQKFQIVFESHMSQSLIKLPETSISLFAHLRMYLD